MGQCAGVPQTTQLVGHPRPTVLMQTVRSNLEEGVDGGDESNGWEVAQRPQRLGTILVILSLAVGPLLLVEHEVRLIFCREALQFHRQLARQARLRGLTWSIILLSGWYSAANLIITCQATSHRTRRRGASSFLWVCQATADIC